MEKLNISIKGGASRILSYSAFCKELYEKNIHVDCFAGASGGSIFSGLLAMKYTPDQIKDFFIGIPGDKTMVVAQKLQTGGYPNIQVPFKIAQIYFDVIFREFSHLKEHLKKHYSWEKCSSKCYFAVFDVHRSLTSTHTPLLWDLNPLEVYDFVKPYYLSNDGIYTVDVLNLKNRQAGFRKISSFVVPMHEAVYSSFCMPFFPPNYIRTPDLGLSQFWDGGFLNNHGNLPFIGKNFIQIEVESPPTVGAIDEAMDRFNEFWYSFNVPKKSFHFETRTDKKELGFFSFQKELVEYEWEAPASNIFPGR